MKLTKRKRVMTDPYKVLEVSRDASMDDIKKQYRALSRKYHPDSNINNPDKDKAEEKFKEVQAAYEQIVYEKEHGTDSSYNYEGNSGSGYGSYNNGNDSYGYGGFGDFYDFFRNMGGSQYGNSQYGNSQHGNSYSSEEQYYRSARGYMAADRYREALNVLSNIPSESRDAEWYYLSAVCNLHMGNNVAASEHARTATSLEPENYDYRHLYEALESGGTWYDRRSEGYGRSHGLNNLCTWCLILNCCCGGSGGYFCCI